MLFIKNNSLLFALLLVGISSTLFAAPSTVKLFNLDETTFTEGFYHHDFDDYDFYYAARIRRFHRPARGFNYYSNYYVDYYWYNPDPYFTGVDIYIIYDRRPRNYGRWNAPRRHWNNYHLAWGWNYQPYRPWYSHNRRGWRHSWNCHNGYNRGYRQGYRAGYWAGRNSNFWYRTANPGNRCHNNSLRGRSVRPVTGLSGRTVHHHHGLKQNQRSANNASRKQANKTAPRANSNLRKSTTTQNSTAFTHRVKPRNTTASHHHSTRNRQTTQRNTGRSYSNQVAHHKQHATHRSQHSKHRAKNSTQQNHRNKAPNGASAIHKQQHRATSRQKNSQQRSSRNNNSHRRR